MQSSTLGTACTWPLVRACSCQGPCGNLSAARTQCSSLLWMEAATDVVWLYLVMRIMLHL